MTIPKRLQLWGAIALFTLITLTLLFAPNNNPQTQGSTYNRFPDGYGAWYEYVQNETNATIQRWRKPFDTFPESTQPPTTFLRVYSNPFPFSLTPEEENWVKAGNTFLLLGVQTTPTQAEFSNLYNTPLGTVKIDTKRRHQLNPSEQAILKDQYGAIVWRKSMGDGQIIYSTTPYLAANAYQNYTANYQLLTYLALSTPNHEFFLNNTLKAHSQTLQNSPFQPNPTPPKIWVDEYIHGYQDKDTLEDKLDSEPNFFNYIQQTPLYPVFMQTIIMVIITLIALNRRFGQPKPITQPSENNSKIYIEALAAVLQKAATHNFVLQTLGKAHQKHLQNKLGLGNTSTDLPTVGAAWQQQTGQSTYQLSQFLKAIKTHKKVSQTELLNWLKSWRKIKQNIE
ncbi:DUF4350 domain-containing protein [Spirulina sp. CS-785/01]|uniref:DUF4350 domain-containing protein n=1 Tax=Spirulina sp. CS-785/01 TaxID=3021716 RepID=UPI00232CBDEF|nr:DUF4350 domain-containing protein [Spirulina sp. CS-785/01]MDB9314270.1 DUF4350 domain-containing protein [Spirulina sp. CS-785/01]